MASTHYAQIVDPRVALLAQWLSEVEREAFEEKAGIRQHLGGYSQGQGEIEALLDVLAGRIAQAEPVVRVFRWRCLMAVASGRCLPIWLSRSHFCAKSAVATLQRKRSATSYTANTVAWHFSPRRPRRIQRCLSPKYPAMPRRSSNLCIPQGTTTTWLHAKQWLMVHYHL